MQGSSLHQFAAVCDSGQRNSLVKQPSYPAVLPCLLASATALQLDQVLNSLKFTLAVPGAQILSEGMTQEQVHAAMDQLRQSTAGADGAQRASTSGQEATPLMQAAARRLSQEAALSSSGDAAAGLDVAPAPAAPAARRLSADVMATAAELQEASRLSATGQQVGSSTDEGEEEEEARPLDINAAVNLAEACAQVGCVCMCLTPRLRLCVADRWYVVDRVCCCRLCGGRRTTAWRSHCTSHRQAPERLRLQHAATHTIAVVPQLSRQLAQSVLTEQQ